MPPPPLPAQNACARHLRMPVRVKMQNTDASTAAEKSSVAHSLEEGSICYPHCLRAVGDRKQRGKIKGTQEQKDMFIERAKADVTNLHHCVTYKQFEALFNITTTHWKEKEKPKQGEFAKWFEGSHHNFWSRAFFIRASGYDYPLYDSNANNIESMHSKIPHVKNVLMRASLTHFLSTTIPAIARWAGLTLSARGWALQPETIPYEMINKVIKRMQTEKHPKASRRHSQVHMSLDKKRYYMLSSEYMKSHPKVRVGPRTSPAAPNSTQKHVLTCSS